MLSCVAGEVLKGWRVYPLQLDDLEPISYSSHKKQPLPVSGNAAPPVLAQELSSPAAEEVGPIFYRQFTCFSARVLHVRGGYALRSVVQVLAWRTELQLAFLGRVLVCATESYRPAECFPVLVHHVLLDLNTHGSWSVRTGRPPCVGSAVRSFSSRTSARSDPAGALSPSMVQTMRRA